jgi:hypothetical protein
MAICSVARDEWVRVTMAWRVLRLRMEERPPIWKVVANILSKPAGGGPPAWGLGEVLTTPYRINVSCYEMFTSASVPE